MLTSDQARVLETLAAEGCKFDPETGELKAVTGDVSLADAADALASLDSIVKGEDLRATILKFLSDLLVREFGFDGYGPFPARTRELITQLSGKSLTPPWPKMSLKRDGVEINICEWIPHEAADALLRIGAALHLDYATPKRLALYVENMAGEAKRNRDIVLAAGELLAALDPEYDGDLTVHALQLASQSARRGEELRELFTYREGEIETLAAEINRLRGELRGAEEPHYEREKNPQRYICWFVENSEEVLEVEALSPEDAALSYFMRKMSERPVHDNVPDPDLVGVVNMETCTGSTMAVRLIHRVEPRMVR